jgi:hypothetical protein
MVGIASCRQITLVDGWNNVMQADNDERWLE